MEISGHTKLLALIGSPVSHSGSPAMYNYSFNKLGIDYTYLAFDVDIEHTKAAVEAAKTFGMRGFNVTMPCKTEVVKYMDELSDAAKIIGAVNTVVIEDGKLYGHNTDGVGYVRNLKEHGVDIKGKKMTILGGGGAATSIQVQCALDGIREISIFNKKDEFWANAEKTVEKIKNAVPSCVVNLYDIDDKAKLKAEIAGSDILTNATRAGMKPLDDVSIIEDTSCYRPELIVTDIVYNPKETKMLREAKACGCRTVGGTGMLLWQGAEAFKLYTGKEMPAEEVKAKYFAD